MESTEIRPIEEIVKELKESVILTNKLALELAKKGVTITHFANPIYPSTTRDAMIGALKIIKEY